MWFDDLKYLAADTQIINDSKTPSGRVHVGSLRGVVLHDIIYRHLKGVGRPVVFRYGIDDYDPLDGLPADASELTRSFMGLPLCNTPAPEGSTATDLAEHYIREFLTVFDDLGVKPEIYRMRDVYRTGAFNEAIDRTLRRADAVREIYLNVSGAQRPADWFPFQVICENCGRIGTTEVNAYDGKEVTYHCSPSLVKWAVGCGHRGKISPFDGRGKLPWKLEWPAKWFTFGITVEGAGKDHCTKGGSRDVADACLRAIYGQEPPLNVPYEFFLVDGAKMSSSKGIGSSAREIADFLPAELLRFLLVRTPPKRAVNFSSDHDQLVKLFNDYDRSVDLIRADKANDDERKIVALSQVSADQPVPPEGQVNFQLLLALLQLPHVDLAAELRRRLGLGADAALPVAVTRRLEAARFWLDNLAKPEDRFELQASLPVAAQDLSQAQRWFLRRLAAALEGFSGDDDALQALLFDVARRTPLPQPAAFSAIYTSLFGVDRGPKAGSLLYFLERDFLARRFTELPFDAHEALAQTAMAPDAWPAQAQALETVDAISARAQWAVGRQGQGGYIELSWQDAKGRSQALRLTGDAPVLGPADPSGPAAAAWAAAAPAALARATPGAGWLARVSWTPPTELLGAA